MKSSWKKIYRPNGTTEVWPDGKKPDCVIEFLCIVPQFQSFTLYSSLYDFCLDNANMSGKRNGGKTP